MKNRTDTAIHDRRDVDAIFTDRLYVEAKRGSSVFEILVFPNFMNYFPKNVLFSHKPWWMKSRAH